jgi:type I restriction enzyme R subunit
MENDIAVLASLAAPNMDNHPLAVDIADRRSADLQRGTRSQSRCDSRCDRLAVSAFVINDETRRRYLQLAGNVDRLFKSLLPDFAANEYASTCKVFSVIAAKIKIDIPATGISDVMDDVSSLLDYSIETQGYVIKASETTNYIDLSQIDFDSLRARFEKGRKAMEAQKLRGAIAQKVTRMVRLNRTRVDFLQEFQKMIDDYNSGASNIETWFAKLTAFAQKLSEEEKRGISEQLTEEELVIFDLLTKPEIKLTKAEEQQVKKVAKQLLENRKERTVSARLEETPDDAGGGSRHH